MLHRIALRVLPSLSVAVTAPDVRRRKRIVMLVPGLVAWTVYLALKQAGVVSHVWLMLATCGLLSSVTAWAAFRVGRRLCFFEILTAERGRLLGWLTGWIGFVYGVQLALLVWALLGVVGYDYLRHPEGPAMMALIIAVTSVARDAFEIGHLRREEAAGRPMLTFPDGGVLRTAAGGRRGALFAWCAGAAVAGALAAGAAAHFADSRWHGLAQVLVVAVVGGAAALIAYAVRSGLWAQSGGGGISPGGLFAFWWWPGAAFAATYELVGIGALTYVAQRPLTGPLAVALGAGVCALMTLYVSALAERRVLEDRVRRTVPESVLRCPFVFGILSKTRPSEAPMPAAAEWLQREAR